MTDILFKAKAKDTGEWVHGYYVKLKDYLEEKDVHIIIPTGATLYPRCEISQYEEIRPETLVQYTGVKDKNGTMIFEGDILSGDLNDEMEPGAKSLVYVQYLKRARAGTGFFIEDMAGSRPDTLDESICKNYEVVAQRIPRNNEV